MNSQQEAILKTLLSVAKHYRKKYCFPSQGHLCNLVIKYHGEIMAVRTLNRRLKELEEMGYIKRIRRHRASVEGKILFASTLYKFKGKAFNWLYSLGNLVRGLFSFFRLPKWAEYKLNQSKIYSSSGGFVSSYCGNPVEKGRASPSKASYQNP